MSDFSKDQGGVQKRPSTGRDPKQAPKPTTGFSEAPQVEQKRGGPGKGIGNTRKGIH